jgi:hypothetical protein
VAELLEHQTEACLYVWLFVIEYELGGGYPLPNALDDRLENRLQDPLE